MTRPAIFLAAVLISAAPARAADLGSLWASPHPIAKFASVGSLPDDVPAIVITDAAHATPKIDMAPLLTGTSVLGPPNVITSGSTMVNLCTLRRNPARLECEGPISDTDCRRRRDGSSQICLAGEIPWVVP